MDRAAPEPTARRGARLRTAWLRVHRWLAWSLGLPLVAVALLGAALIVLKPLDQALNARLFQATAAPPAPGLLERTRAILVHEFGPRAALTFRPPRAPGESLAVIVRGPWQGTVYLDPATAAELGRRGEREGFFNLAFELHSTLLLDDAGKPLLAALAAGYLVLLASGLVLWWPRQWRRAWSVALHRGTLRGLFDLHRAGGSLLGLLILVPVASGAYMAWRPLSATITAWAGHPPVQPPRVPAGAVAEPATLDQLVAGAQARFPEGMVGYVQVPPAPPAPAGTARPVRVRLKLPDDPHPNGLTSVWCHPASGAVLQVDRWNRLDVGARAYAVIYPLHTGTLGGLAHEALNLLLGLALAGLGASGWWMWWLRRRARAGQPARSGTAAAPQLP